MARTTKAYRQKTIPRLRKGRPGSREKRAEFLKGLRDAQKRDLRSVRGEKYTWHKDGGRDTKKKPYRFRGDRHRARRLFTKQGLLRETIPKHLSEVLERGGRARILDVGPGKGLYWVPVLNSFGAEARKIELHALNPSRHFDPFIPTTDARKHHGTAETKSLARLGRFDLITAFYSIGQIKTDFYQVIKKLSSRVSVQGRLVIVFGPTLERAKIEKALGKGFEIETLRMRISTGQKTFNKVLVAKRIK